MNNTDSISYECMASTDIDVCQVVARCIYTLFSPEHP